MKKFILNIVLIAIAIYFTSCNEKATIEPNLYTANNEIFPLKLNNYFLYNISSFDSLGQIFNYNVYSNLIERDSFYNNEHYYFSYQGFGDGQYLSNKNDGLYLIANGVGFNSPKLFIKYPANQGDTYLLNLNDSGSEIGNWRVTVESIDTLIQVRVGKFKCNKYSIIPLGISNIAEIDYYFAKGYGLIKKDDFAKNNKIFKINSIWELSHYRIF